MGANLFPILPKYHISLNQIELKPNFQDQYHVNLENTMRLQEYNTTLAAIILTQNSTHTSLSGLIHWIFPSVWALFSLVIRISSVSHQELKKIKSLWDIQTFYMKNYKYWCNTSMTRDCLPRKLCPINQSIKTIFLLSFLAPIKIYYKKNELDCA